MLVLRLCSLRHGLVQVVQRQQHHSPALKSAANFLRQQFRQRGIKADNGGGGGKYRLGQLTASLGLLGLTPVVKVAAQSEDKRKSGDVALHAASKDDEVEEAQFDWRQFLQLLLPHLGHMLAAVATALAVAVLNIQDSGEFEAMKQNTGNT
jgi:hypothetical protein